MTGEQATTAGYRRVSNKYRTVARIDRPDWVQFLANELRRAPADFYVPGEPNPTANWADYYRRTYSQDTITLTPEEFHKVPGSTWDPCGYVEKEEEKENLDFPDGCSHPELIGGES